MALPSTRHRHLLFSAELHKLGQGECFCSNKTAAALGPGELYPGVLPSQSLCQSPPQGPEHSSGQAEVMSPPKEACYSLGKDWDDSDLLRDLETPQGIQMVLIPAGPRGCGSAPYPHPLGEKGSGLSDKQSFEGFPWPDSFIPAITAMTGKGIFFGSHKSIGKRKEASPHPVEDWVPLGFVLGALLTRAASQPCSCPKA